MRPAGSIPLVDLSVVHERWMRDNILQRISTIAACGELIDGAEVDQFEERWADYVGARYCVGVGNGTDALELAVRATIGRKSWPAVVLPAMTFVATAEAVVRAGENVALVDVDDQTLLAPGVDVAVGLYGQPVPWADRDSGVVDAAQMHGHKAPGVTASWSFYPTKNLGAWGDAGAVTTDDEGVADGIRELARHGYGGATGCGFNSRLDTVQAAVLIEKLPRLDEWVEARRQAVGSYKRRLAVHGIAVVGDWRTSVCHLCVVRVPERDAVLRKMAKRHIGCGAHYARSLSSMAWLNQFRMVGSDPFEAAFVCPIADRAAREVLSLPLWPGISASTMDRVVEGLVLSIDEAQREAEQRG